MSFQEFHKILSSVKDEKKSGKMYVSMVEGSVRKIANLLLNEGELLRISYSQLEGVDALQKMLCLWVDNVVFIPSSPDSAAQWVEGTPHIETVLELTQKLLFPGETDPNSSKPDSLNHYANTFIDTKLDKVQLRGMVELVMKEIYGAGFKNQLEAIAHSYSPEYNPSDFLEECKRKASLLISKKKVDRLFSPIYEKIK